MKENRPQLTISLLISNRMDTIPRCLDSLRPIMEAIACELILIDTSKNPEVHGLLLEYTAQVYEFEWCQDFAKARNEGMKRARGEWFLYLDDDEWFVEVDEIIEFFKSGEYKKYGYANYIQRNFTDETYSYYKDHWTSRLVRLDGNVKFVSKIHEYFEPVTGPRKDLYAIANHSGYIYNTPEKRNAHFERNYPLLLDMIQEEPTHLRWHLQLVQEFVSVAKWEELIQFCEECLQFVEKETSDAMRNNIATFYEGIALGFFSQKKYKECICACKRALADKRAKEVLIAKMHLRLAENYLYLEEFDEAMQHSEEYLCLIQGIDRKSAAIREQEFALLVGDAFEENYQKMMYYIMICCHLEKGNMEPLVKYYDKLSWNQEMVCCITNVEKYMVKAMWSTPYHPIFLRIITDVLGNKGLREYFRKEILVQDMQETNEFQRCLYDFERTIQVLVDGPVAGDMIAYYKVLQQYVGAVCEWSDFTESQGELVINNGSVPSYFQAAVHINDYFELETQNIVEALAKLKGAVDAMPEFADGIGYFLQCYSDLDKQRAEVQKAEMEALRVQVVAQVNAMLATGQIKVAKEIIGQLSLMFPDDREIEELVRTICIENVE